MDITSVTTTKGKTCSQSNAAKIKDEDKAPNNKKWTMKGSSLLLGCSIIPALPLAVVSPVLYKKP